MNAAGQPTDEQLAIQAQAGCLESFDQLVRRHQARLYQFLCHLTGNHSIAEDVAQETFIRAWRRLHQYRPRYRFVSWLYAIARREAITHWRRQPPPCAPLSDSVPAASKSDDEIAEVWYLARRILPEKQYTALWLMYAEQLSVHDIARVMALTGIHVKVLLHRGRQRLACALTSPTRKEHHDELRPSPMENFAGGK